VWCNKFSLNHGDLPGNFISVASKSKAYELSAPDSDLILLLVLAYCGLKDTTKIFLQEYPKGYLVDTLLLCREGCIYESLEVENFDPCSLHDHATPEEQEGCEIRVQMDRGLDTTMN